MQKQVTLKDIAIAASTSASTVSRALSNHPAIPDKTKSAILKIAKDLNYRPNPNLSALARERWKLSNKQIHNTIAFIIWSDIKKENAFLHVNLSSIQLGKWDTRLRFLKKIDTKPLIN